MPLTYRPELDGLRGASILLVVAGHYRLVPPFAALAGVTMFFVLSGYLITSLLIAEHRATGRVDLRAFIVRRVRRLAPALVVTILATGVIVAIAGQFDAYPVRAIMAASYVANFAPGGGESLGPLQHTWSLAIEEQFYLVWPALFLILRQPRLRLAVLAGGIAWAIGARLLFGDVAGRTDLRMDGLLLGCAIALAPVILPRWSAVPAAAVIGITVAATNDLSIGMPIVAAAAAVLILSRAPLTWAPLVRVGTVSYGLYLYHNIFPYEGWWQSTPLVIAGLVLSFGAAFASERWLERRFRRPRRASEPATARLATP